MNKQQICEATQMDSGSEEEYADNDAPGQAQVVVEEIEGTRLLRVPMTEELTVSRVLDMGIQKLRYKGVWLRKCVTWLQNPKGDALAKEAPVHSFLEPGKQHLTLTLRSNEYILCEIGRYERWTLAARNMWPDSLGNKEIMEICEDFATAIGTSLPNWLSTDRKKQELSDGNGLYLLLIHPPEQQQPILLKASKTNGKIERLHFGQLKQDLIPVVRATTEEGLGERKLVCQCVPNLEVEGTKDILLRAAQLIAMHHGKAWDGSCEAQLIAITRAYFRAARPILVSSNTSTGKMVRLALLPSSPFSTAEKVRADDSVPIGVKVCPYSPQHNIKLLYSNHMVSTTTAFMYVDLREKLWPDGGAVARAMAEQAKRQIPLLVLKTGEGMLIPKKYITEYSYLSEARECSECGKDATWLVKVVTPVGYDIKLEQTIKALYEALPWEHTDWLEGARHRFECWLAKPPPPQ